MSNFLKWWQTIRISWSRYTAYRLNFFLQVIGPALVFFFIKYSLWTSVFDNDASKVIEGYTLSGMINYHIWTLIVGLLAQGHTAMNLSEDIRLGRISTYLIYPFNFWEFHTASFISFQILQFFISMITIGLFFSLGILGEFNLQSFVAGVGICLYVSFFWYLLQYLTGILAFWLEETWVLRVMLQIVAAFLSGAIIPLDLFPEIIREILMWTPFPYLTYFPVKVFSGELSLLPTAFGVVTVWMIIIFGVNKIIWNRGIKNYTAAGI